MLCHLSCGGWISSSGKVTANGRHNQIQSSRSGYQIEMPTWQVWKLMTTLLVSDVMRQLHTAREQVLLCFYTRESLD